jgi:hypothetical protein
VHPANSLRNPLPPPPHTHKPHTFPVPLHHSPTYKRVSCETTTHTPLPRAPSPQDLPCTINQVAVLNSWAQGGRHVHLPVPLKGLHIGVGAGGMVGTMCAPAAAAQVTGVMG